MLYQVPPQPLQQEASLVLGASTRLSSIERKLDLNRACPRRLSGLCLGLGCTLPKLDVGLLSLEESSAQSTLIHASSLRFNILKEIGKVNVEWTDVLSTHLIFNAITRTLYLFRLPSFCAVSCISGDKPTISDL